MNAATVAPSAATPAAGAAAASPTKANATATVVPLARPEPAAKRPFESAIPADEQAKKAEFGMDFMNQIIEGGKTALNDVAKSFTQFIDDIKPAKLECLNGGEPAANQRECKCNERRWTGKRCETMVCHNGGHLITLSDKTEVCRCAPEEFITGAHCDVITCQNGGMALPDASGCDCNTIYTGQFCETNIFITNAHIGIPALVLFIFLCCCFLCRMDLCPRRPPPASGRSGGGGGRRSRSRQPVQQQHGLLRQHEQPPLLQYVPPPAAAAAAAASGSNAYVIRLDTIPTFNPQMIGGVPIEEGKILEPPPPYDEALNARCTIEPPRYEEQPPEGSQVRGMSAGVVADEGRDRRRATPR